jgi:preprotein translocase subunit YajC
VGFIVIIVTFGLMWVLLILPQQRRVRAHQAVVAKLAVGDEVMTTSGIYGTVLEMDGEAIQLKVAEGVVLKVARAAVASTVTPADPSDASDGPEVDRGSEDAGADADVPATSTARVIQPRRGLSRRRPSDPTEAPGAADN